MDQAMSSVASATLPCELVLHIVSFAAPSTLAAICQCSFELLKYAAPFLYDKVTLTRADQYGKLFCERDPTTSHPRLHPYLSLTQIHHLHFFISSAHPSLQFLHRLPPGQPLPLLTLEITYTSLAPRGRQHDIFPHLLPATLLFSCSPELAQAASSGNYLSQNVHALIDVGPHAMTSMVRAWKGVREVVLCQTMPVIVSRQGFQAFVFEHVNADLPPQHEEEREGEGKGMEIVLDLTDRVEGAKADWTRVFTLGAMLSKFGSPAGGVGRKVVVRVLSEKDAEWVRRGMRVTRESGDVMSPVEVQVMGRRRERMEE